MRISAGVPWTGAKRQWGNRKHWAFGRHIFGTLGNDANSVSVIYLVCCRLSPFYQVTNPKRHDLEWLEWPFYVKFSLLRTDLESIIVDFDSITHLFTVQSVYINVTSGDVGNGVADCDPQNIWNPRKNCRSVS